MREKMYTSTEVAERLGIARSTINMWCRKGRFTGAHHLFGSKMFGWIIPESAVQAMEELGYEGVITESVSAKLESDQQGDTV